MYFLIWMIIGFIITIFGIYYDKDKWYFVDSLGYLIFTVFGLSLFWPVLFFIILQDFLCKKRNFWFHKK